MNQFSAEHFLATAIGQKDPFLTVGIGQKDLNKTSSTNYLLTTNPEEHPI
jgi:hypothetical protein